MRSLCVLGSTGSIGVSTLDVVARHPDRYKIVALSANQNSELLYQQCLTHKPDQVVLVDQIAAQTLRDQLSQHPEIDTDVLGGVEALQQIAALETVDTVMAAIVGAAGLMPTLAAANSGKRVLLANKEALVMSGQLLLDAVAKSGAELLPVDSEHNAIFQCMPPDFRVGGHPKGVKRILLTASGGPFRTISLDQLPDVTPEQAIAHPNWDMGKKISVDSATMMNKGLEFIEASLLFDMPENHIQVVIHPQSVIHSMVDYTDGSILAQLGNPDMRVPIAHTLAWPERFESGVEPLDIFKVKRLDFEPPDEDRFPCLKLAYAAVHDRGIMPTVLNAANEIAVASFLADQIRFTDIYRIIAHSMDRIDNCAAHDLEVVLDSDRRARKIAETYISTNLH